MAAVDPAVIEKIRALLNVKGRTPEEATLYVTKAQALADKHGLEMSQLEGKPKSSSVVETARTDIFERGKPGEWRMGVFEAVAKSSRVWAMTGYRLERMVSKAGRERYARFTTAYFVGLPVDVEVAGYTYAFLVNELERLAGEYAGTLWDEIKEYAKRHGLPVHEAEGEYAQARGTHPLRAKVSWLKGAAEGVGDMLSAAADKREDATPDSKALVVDREAAIRDYWSLKHYGKTTAERQAELRERYAKERADAAANPMAVSASKPIRPRTAKQIAKDTERAEKAARREERREQAAWDRLHKTTDWDAFNHGEETGRAMRIRAGIGS